MVRRCVRWMQVFPPVVLISLGVIVSPLNCVASDWPEFRGPTVNGVSLADGLPIRWAAPGQAGVTAEHLRWRTELPGEGWSSPIVVQNSIYVTAAIPKAEGGYELALLILDGETGALTRTVSLFEEPANAADIHTKNSHASPTPTASGERLYVHFGHQGTACARLDGEVLWRNRSLEYVPVHGNGGSPCVVGDKVVVTRDGGNVAEVTALDAETGQVVWQTEREVDAERTFSFCTPLVIEADGTTQLIVPGSDVVQSLDPENGDEFWRVAYQGFSVVPRPVYESGLVFVSTGFMRPSFLAIDPAGRGDITESHVVWSSKNSVPKTPSVVSTNGRVWMISDNGVASCLDAKTGKVLWRKRVGGNFSASPVLAGGQMYVVSEEGLCSVIDANDGTVVSENDFGERSLASPAVIESDLLIRTSAALYRISRP